MQVEVYKNLKQTWINFLKKKDQNSHLEINWKDIVVENENCCCSGCFTTIYNSKAFELEYIDGNYKEVLGYSKEELNANFFATSIHEIDLPIINKFEKIALLYFSDLTDNEKRKYTYKYDARYQKKNGDYLRLQKEVSLVCVSENPLELRLIEKYSNINSFKKDKEPSLCFNYLGDVEVNLEKQNEKTQTISPAEKKVLHLLIDGLSSKEIADKLHLSKETVDTHRKNMIKKLNVSNTSQLIAKSLINQLITI
ncbi:MAG: LuxR C-terminal-related transcriptional regulator [Bacteroidota bacterium]